MSVDLADLDGFALNGEDMDAVLAAATQSLAQEDGRLVINPESVERDLAKLVLVVVELLRRLMEHQALARMDRGTLSEAQIDALSEGLSRAAGAIEHMRETFGIPIEDFNVDLGLLGKVL